MPIARTNVGHGNGEQGNDEEQKDDASRGDAVALGTPRATGILAASIVGSGMAQLDATVVNVALERIGRDLTASLETLQWVVNGYMLALSALILLGGSLGDLFGRRRLFSLGVVVFALASVVCGLAPGSGVLIAARVAQGIGGAMLAPASLAMLQGAFRARDRGHAIGTWSSLGSVAGLLGPLVGGALVQFASWRWAFWINVPLALVALWAARRFVPESRAPHRARIDVPGAVLAAVTLAGLTLALIMPGSAWTLPGWIVAGLGAVAFVLVERRVRAPMVPLGLFADRTFTGANAMTLLTYAGMGAMSFFLSLQLQVSLGWGALWAGLAQLPTSVCMILLAGRFGALASRRGPRAFMTVGPLVAALGVLVLSLARRGDTYLWPVLPGVILFGLGLAVFVAALTSTALTAAPDENAGIASGVNNAVARTGSLLAVAALPALVGLSGRAYSDPALMTDGFQRGLWIAAGLMALGGATAWATTPSGPMETGGAEG